ncbi:MAG: primosomal protein N' [Fuerstiella sp.]|nr:primosomal protein N' [Fuerstiella sp.]
MGNQGLFDFADLPEWEQAAQDDVQIADVVFNLPLEKPYTYTVSDELREILRPGMRVRAPLGRGNRLVAGYCVGVRQSARTTTSLKPILEVLDPSPLLSTQMLQLTEWIAKRYLCGWGQVLESVVPAGVKRRSGTRMIQGFLLAADAEQRLCHLRLPPGQQSVIDVLRGTTDPISAPEICERAGCGPGPITGLRKKNLLEVVRVRSKLEGDTLERATSEPDLQINPQQRACLAAIHKTIDAQQHQTILLHGVTGSGKTEVYIQAIREIVRYGRQAIVLVPEISLTPQTIRRFGSRFRSVAVLHSHMSDSERHWQWQQIAKGDVEVVVGARSAVFAPAPHLGLIVIDEEHEPTFKQESTPRYHAREVARQRCRMEKIPLVLGSATPTLESWLRSQRKEDQLLSMPDRVSGLPLPPVVVVDIRNDPVIARGASLGRALQQAVRRALADGGQVILFLNLRGYSPTVWCRKCGSGIKCPDCDLTLTWHRDRQSAICHGCDYSVPAPDRCPSCDNPSLRYFGTGTQKLEEEVAATFEEAVIVRMDSDSMKKPGSHDSALERFRSGEVQILLGTQMIAKGLDFPNVTLVGVIDADSMLNQPDMRAAERTFQLISQVAGRTGRSDRGGRVIVQTTCPEDASITFAAKHDYLGFARYELKERHELSAPPFNCVTRVIFRGLQESLVSATSREAARQLREVTEKDSQVRILGAAPAPISRLRAYFRYHLQIAAPTEERVREVWLSVASVFQLPDGVEMAVDVDPINSR